MWQVCGNLTPENNSAPGSCHLTAPSQWDGEEEQKEVKPMGWDKNSLITEIKQNLIVLIIVIVMNRRKE